MTRIIRAALAALTLVAVIATPVAAGKHNKPIVQEIEDSGTSEIVCETVTLTEAYSRSVKVKRWLDDDGSVTRGQARIRFEGTITGPGSTLRVSDTGHFTSYIEYGPDGPTVRQVGMMYKLTAPGHGLIALDVGVLTFFPDGSVDVKGRHDVFENGIEALVCPLFE